MSGDAAQGLIDAIGLVESLRPLRAMVVTFREQLVNEDGWSPAAAEEIATAMWVAMMKRIMETPSAQQSPKG